MKWLHAKKAITGDGKTVLTPAWIGIEGKYIEAVQDLKPETANPENTVELGDVTLTPGLLNIHDHICRKTLRVHNPNKSFSERATKLMAMEKDYLILLSAYNMRKYITEEGITWVRDYGLAGRTSINLKLAIAEGYEYGPEIDACVEPICITGGHCYRQSYEADGVTGVIKAVRMQVKRGATVIKFMGSGGLEHFPNEDPTCPQFTLEELTAGVNAAHDLGLDTAIHAYSNEGIRRAVLAGIDNIEHGAMMTEDLIEEMVKRGTHFNPTMTGVRGAFKTGPMAKYWDLLTERIYSKQEDAIRKAHSAGILIGAGTDTAGVLWEEIEMIRKVLGETPVQGLAHGTSINAKIAKRPDLGLLEKGRRADIVAFKGDLTKSLEGMANGVVATWKEGVVYKGIAAEN